MIPVSASVWQNILVDADLRRLSDEAGRRLGQVASTPTFGDDESALRIALRELAVACEQAAHFRPVGETVVGAAQLRRVAATVRRSERTSPGPLSRAKAAALGRAIHDLATRLDTVASPPVPPDDSDAVELMFGVPRHRLLDARGVVASDRIMAAFASRQATLRKIGRQAAAGIAPRGARLPHDPTMLPASLALTHHPFICRAVAQETLETVRRALERSPDDPVAVIVRLQVRIPEAASSHFDATVATSERLRVAPPKAVEARLRLERYRSVLEGQLRYTAWATLRLRGDIGAGPVPMLGRLRRLLEDDGSPACRYMASAINESWRNAAAHDDAYWDPDSAGLRAGGAVLYLGELDDAVDIAYAAVYGFEVGVAMIRAASPSFGAAIDRAAPVPPTALKDLGVRRIFGGRGRFVWQTEWSPDGIDVVLDDEPDDSNLSPLLAAVLQAAIQCDLRRDWRLSGRNGTTRVVVDRTALVESERLLPRRRGAVPSDVLLPMMAGAVLASGADPVECRRAIARVALNEPMLAGQALMSAIVGRERAAGRRVIRSLRRAAQSLEAAWRVVGTPADLDDVPSACRSTARAVERWTRDGNGYAGLADGMNALLDIAMSLPLLRLDVAGRG